MKSILTIALMFTIVAGHTATLSAQSPSTGVITGVVSGFSNDWIPDLRITIVNSEGLVVRTATTSAIGSFTVSGLEAGRYSVQAISGSGAVLSTQMATLTEPDMRAMIRMTSVPVFRARSGGSGGVPAAGAAVGDFRVVALVAGVASAATAVGVAAIVASGDDASPSR